MAAIVGPGDEVVMEHPVYEPIASLARYLGAAVRPFPRRPRDAYRIDPDEVGRQVTARTRPIVLANLHNPSGALADEAALRALGGIARRAGARALLERNRAILDRFPDSRDDLEAFRPGAGTVLFPRWPGGDAERLCEVLRDRYETTVVPGRFFGMPDHFRIGGEIEDLRSGLERLAAALDDPAARRPEA